MQDLADSSEKRLLQSNVLFKTRAARVFYVAAERRVFVLPVIMLSFFFDHPTDRTGIILGPKRAHAERNESVGINNISQT